MNRRVGDSMRPVGGKGGWRSANALLNCDDSIQRSGAGGGATGVSEEFDFDDLTVVAPPATLSNSCSVNSDCVFLISLFTMFLLFETGWFGRTATTALHLGEAQDAREGIIDSEAGAFAKTPSRDRRERASRTPKLSEAPGCGPLPPVAAQDETGGAQRAEALEG